MINSLLNRTAEKSGPFVLNDDARGKIKSPQAVADKFNEFFANIAPKIKAEISSRTTFDPGGIHDTLNVAITNSIYIQPTDATEIYEVINGFKNKATLDTKIGPLKIASSCVNFTSTLSALVNHSFSEGVFPESLKIAKIVPVHKGGSKLEVSN